MPQITIQVSKDEILFCDIARVVSIFSGFIPDLLEVNRNKVQIEVMGYDKDKRELFDIPEVRKYFQTLFDKIPSLFYWIDLDSYMFVFLGLMLYTPLRVKNGVTIDPSDFRKYLIRGFMGLNEFCKSNGLSPKPTNMAIKNKLEGKDKV